MKKFVYLIMAMCLGYMTFHTSCANIGMPTGGDKDSIAPEIVQINPLPNQTNFNKQILSMTFDEYVVSTDVPTKMLVSPPIIKKAAVRMRSKTMMIDFKEQLKPNQTYSIDFRNSIKDNNEGNPMENFRMAFSTGNELDTLLVGGYVRTAETMEPMPDILLSLYAIDSLHYFRDSIPNYIGMSDEEGFFMISNVKAGKYRLYALQDLDNSLTYNSSDELIAFIDTLISPTVVDEKCHEHLHFLNDSILATLPDSIAQILSDSIVLDKTIEALPDSIKTSFARLEKEYHNDHSHQVAEPFYLKLYEENEFDQYLNGKERKRKNLCSFFFDEQLSDSFKIDLIKPKISNIKDWGLLEYTLNRDSLFVWITDTTIASLDTLGFSLTYTMLNDSLKTLYSQTDTINLTFTDGEAGKKRKKAEDKDGENKMAELPHFAFNSNATKEFDIYKDLTVVSAEPLKELDYSMIHLYRVENDTIEKPVEFQFMPDSLNLCKYYVKYPWKFEEKYHFYIDSAAAMSISEMPSHALAQQLAIKPEDYYAKISLTLSNISSPTIIQLLKPGKTETIIASQSTASNGVIEFPLLNPDKFAIKAIIDANNNGKFDVGDIDSNLQPESVLYYPKVIKLRSNFEVQENWELPSDLNSKKELIDEDEKEKEKFGGPKAKNNQR
ncbi:MAG: Ig-like domain-containing domain [Mangrovibacterium sp.]